MSDKPKNIQEALEQVKRNTQSITEQDVPFFQRPRENIRNWFSSRSGATNTTSSELSRNRLQRASERDDREIAAFSSSSRPSSSAAAPAPQQSSGASQSAAAAPAPAPARTNNAPSGSAPPPAASASAGRTPPAAPGTSGATMPGGTARATGFGISGAQSSSGSVAKATPPKALGTPKPQSPQTFGQAFAAARKEAGGAGGKFTWQGKEYQTNIAGEKYSPAGQLKAVGGASDTPKPSATPSGSSETRRAEGNKLASQPEPGFEPEKKTEPPPDQANAMNLDPTKKKTNGTTTNEETKMSPMIQAFLKLHSKESNYNMFNEAKKHKKHLDPVGKEDEDIDNDGDSDKSDQYLHNRRKAIGKAIKESGDEGTAGAVKKDGKDVVSPTAPGGSGYKKEGPSDKERDALTKKIEKIQKEKTTNEEVEQIDELSKDKLQRYSKAARPERLDPEKGVKRRAGMDLALKKIIGGDRYGNKPKVKATREEVEFSEAELTHIAAIMEISVPVSPVADDYTGSNHGVSKRDLTDETMSEEEAMKRGRGRPAGKYGAYKRKDTAGADGEEEKAEPKNLVAQNPRTYNKDGKNMVDLEHPSKPGVKRTVPAKHYNDFRSSYLNAEKPAEKQKMHDSMVDRVFGKS